MNKGSGGKNLSESYKGNQLEYFLRIQQRFEFFFNLFYLMG
jgi:hypothetical protein